jgi:serine/threonine protein kinase
VYSLGVLLYELLIGAVPFDTATLRNAGLAEMLRIIREDEAPSCRESSPRWARRRPSIAARRQTDPVSLRRLVDGDLNSITMKALEKARERRYASVVRPRSRYPESPGAPARAGLAAGQAVPNPEVSPQARLAALGTAAGLVFLVLIG